MVICVFVVHLQGIRAGIPKTCLVLSKPSTEVGDPWLSFLRSGVPLGVPFRVRSPKP